MFKFIANALLFTDLLDEGGSSQQSSRGNSYQEPSKTFPNSVTVFIDEDRWGYWAVRDREGNYASLSSDQDRDNFIIKGLNLQPNNDRAVSKVLERGRANIDGSYWASICHD